jgi:hypothetical protein
MALHTDRNTIDVTIGGACYEAEIVVGVGEWVNRAVRRMRIGDVLHIRRAPLHRMGLGRVVIKYGRNNYHTFTFDGEPLLRAGTALEAAAKAIETPAQS